MKESKVALARFSQYGVYTASLNSDPFNRTAALTKYYETAMNKNTILENDTIYKAINSAIYRVKRQIALVDGYYRDLEYLSINTNNLTKCFNYELKCWKSFGAYCNSLRDKEKTSSIENSKYNEFKGNYFDYMIINDSYNISFALDSLSDSKNTTYTIIKFGFFVLLVSCQLEYVCFIS